MIAMNFGARRFAWGILGSIFFSAAWAAGPPRPSHAPGEVLVRWRDGAQPPVTQRRGEAPIYDASALAAIPGAAAIFDHELLAVEALPMPNAGRRSDASVKVLSAGSPMHRLVFSSDVNVTALAAELERLPGVAYAEPNYLGALTYTPNDTLFPQQIDLALINLEEAWDAQGGSPGANNSVVVAVIDSGVAAGHPDLTGVNVAASYNFVTDDNTVLDDLGHGTRVAGIIGATANNSEGIAGVAFGCTILSLDVIGSDGSATVADVASAVRYATAQGADIINLSLGFDPYSQTLKDACDEAEAAGVLVIAAAGNENQGDLPFYPASYSSVMGVGAVDDTGARAAFSNYNGLQKDLVEIVAPGVTIFSTIPASQYNGTFGSGTSFAAPVVAGVAALIKSENPGQNGAALRAHLKATASPLPGFLPAGGAGAGIANAQAALETSMTPVVKVASIIVSDDGDNDGALDVGETAHLILKLQSESADALNVTATISTTDPDITGLTNNSATYTAIRVGNEASNISDPFGDLVVSATAGVKRAPFQLTLSGDNGFNQMLEFDLNVEDELEISGVKTDYVFTNDNTYHATGTVILNGSTTIEAGTVIKSEPNVTIRINSGGSLEAIGTELEPIRFTSARASSSNNYKRAAPAGVGPQTDVIDFSRTDARYFYVDPVSGSDVTGTGDPENPFATLQKASSIPIFTPHFFRIIIAAEGRYTGSGSYVIPESIRTHTFGGHQSGTWIRDIHEYPSILDGEGVRGGAEFALLQILDGFFITNTTQPTLFSSNALLSTIRNNYIDGNVELNGTSAILSNNQIVGAVSLGSSMASSSVSGNLLFGGLACAPVAEIKRNVIIGATAAGVSVPGSATSVSLTNNIVALNGAEGIVIGPGATGVNLVNNTIVGNLGAGISSASAAQIINNIVWNNDTEVAAPAGATLMNNVIDGGYSGSGDVGTQTADPKIEELALSGIVQSFNFETATGEAALAVGAPNLEPDVLSGEIILIDDLPFLVLSNTANEIRVFGDPASRGVSTAPVAFAIKSYRLTSEDSSAHGNGIGPDSEALVPNEDIDGEQRTGTTVDIGVDEFDSLTATNPLQFWGRLEFMSGVTTATLTQVVVENGRGIYTEDADLELTSVISRNNLGDGIASTVPLAHPSSGLLTENNFGIGINLPGSEITDSTARLNVGAGIVAGAVYNSLAESNTAEGIIADSADVSSANYNGLEGFVLDAGGTMLGATGNGGDGITTSGGNISTSQAYENGGSGITVSGGGLVTNSIASLNKLNGIVTDGSAVVDSVADRNGVTGIIGSGASTLSNGRVTNNFAAGIAGVDIITGGAIASNGTGISGASSISGAYIVHNAGVGVSSSLSIADSTIAKNSSHGIVTFSSISNSWVTGNGGDGVVAIPGNGTVVQSTISENTGHGTRNILSINQSNIVSNGEYQAFDSDSGSAIRDFTNNWWGTTSDIDLLIFDVLDNSEGSISNHQLDYEPFSLIPVANSPGLEPPAFLFAATPNMTSPALLGEVTFTLVFSEAMNTSVNMAVTFDTDAPYTAHVVEPAPGWISATTWQGRFYVDGETGDGLNTMRITGAEEANGFLLPDDTAHTFIVDGDEPGTAQNGLAAATGTGTVRLTWDSAELEARRAQQVLGYHIRRSQSGEAGEFERINAVIVTELEYYDTDLPPSTTFHYIIDWVDLDHNSYQHTPPLVVTTNPDTSLQDWMLYE